MEFYRLPAYRKATEFVKQLALSTQKVPRARQALISEMINKAIGIMVQIGEANEDNSGDRKKFLEGALNDLAEIRIMVRCLYDLQYIPKKGLDAISGRESELERQLEGWLKNPYGNNEQSTKRKVLTAGSSTALRKLVAD